MDVDTEEVEYACDMDVDPVGCNGNNLYTEPRDGNDVCWMDVDVPEMQPSLPASLTQPAFENITGNADVDADLYIYGRSFDVYYLGQPIYSPPVTVSQSSGNGYVDNGLSTYQPDRMGR
ncbi:hypothetical protein FBU59_002399 [Linderina macrospora]|uniref:Uncharacterized protein n=1 Tax=Linderina macrospora TaxID=4868 RepID=A0ACC1JBB7_9FUNG|nr:hypothetical protein FBU59_002399 [Linderina macrospora]